MMTNRLRPASDVINYCYNYCFGCGNFRPLNGTLRCSSCAVRLLGQMKERHNAHENAGHF